MLRISYGFYAVQITRSQALLPAAKFELPEKITYDGVRQALKGMFTDEDRKALQSAPVHVKFQVVCYEKILPKRELDLARFTGPESEKITW